MRPALVQEPVNARPLRHVIARPAGQLCAQAVGGEFGFGGAPGVAQVPVGDLVPGEEGEFVPVEAGQAAFGKRDLADVAGAVDCPAGLSRKAGQAGAFAAVGVIAAAIGQAGAGHLDGDGKVIGRQGHGPQRRGQQGKRHDRLRRQGRTWTVNAAKAGADLVSAGCLPQFG